MEIISVIFIILIAVAVMVMYSVITNSDKTDYYKSLDKWRKKHGHR